MVKGVVDKQGFDKFIETYFDVVEDEKVTPLEEIARNESLKLKLAEMTGIVGAYVDNEGCLRDSSGDFVFSNDGTYITTFVLKFKVFLCKYCGTKLCKRNNKYDPMTLINHLTVEKVKKQGKKEEEVVMRLLLMFNTLKTFKR